MASENELTIPELEALNAQEMATDDYNGLNTLLYVIRGLGADRDRKMTFVNDFFYSSGIASTTFLRPSSSTLQ